MLRCCLLLSLWARHSVLKMCHFATLRLVTVQIQMVPREMGKMKSLRELLLFANQLHDLPFEIGLLYQIHTLGLHGNPLDEPINT